MDKLIGKTFRIIKLSQNKPLYDITFKITHLSEFYYQIQEIKTNYDYSGLTPLILNFGFNQESLWADLIIGYVNNKKDTMDVGSESFKIEEPFIKKLNKILNI